MNSALTWKNTHTVSVTHVIEDDTDLSYDTSNLYFLLCIKHLLKLLPPVNKSHSFRIKFLMLYLPNNFIYGNTNITVLPDTENNHKDS